MFTLGKQSLEIADNIFVGQTLCVDGNVLAEIEDKCEQMIASSAKAVLEVTGRIFAEQTVYFDSNLLALLGDQKATLAAQIAELKGQAARYQLELSNSLQSLTDSLIDVTVPSICEPCPPAVSLVPGGCTRCGHTAGLFECCVPAGCAAAVSFWCPFCGAGNVGVGWGVPAPFVFLAQVGWQLIEAISKISKAEKLLSIVIAAVVILLRWLRTTVAPFTIAVSQRQFFTHHGAHPPTDQPFGSSGLFFGRGFQPAIAA